MAWSVSPRDLACSIAATSVAGFQQSSCLEKSAAYISLAAQELVASIPQTLMSQAEKLLKPVAIQFPQETSNSVVRDLSVIRV